MKKLLIITFMLITVVLFAAPGHDTIGLKEANLPTTVIWQIVGTEVDTSAWYRSNPTMDFAFFARDTTTGANGDSVALTITYQCLIGSRIISAADTKAITTTDDSVNVEWRKTDVSTCSGMYFRLLITGGAANDQDAGSLIEIDYDGYPSKLSR